MAFYQTFEIDIKLHLNCTGFLESIIYIEMRSNPEYKLQIISIQSEQGLVDCHEL